MPAGGTDPGKLRQHLAGQIMLRGVTCQSCRVELAAAQRAVPCDSAGLAGCRYWRLCQASPGTPVEESNRRAMIWAERIQACGWQMATALMPLTLQAAEAHLLLRQLAMIQQYQGLAQQQTLRDNHG